MRTMAKVPATASAKLAKRIATTVGIFAPAGVEILLYERLICHGSPLHDHR
jgi:hypothetical protein